MLRLGLWLLSSIFESSCETADDGRLVIAGWRSGWSCVNGLQLQRAILLTRGWPVRADSPMDRGAQAAQAWSSRQTATSASATVRVFSGGCGKCKLAGLTDGTDAAGRSRPRSPTTFHSGPNQVVNCTPSLASSKVLAALKLRCWFGAQLVQRWWVTRLADRMLTSSSLSRSKGSSHRGSRITCSLWKRSYCATINVRCSGCCDDIGQAGCLLMPTAESVGRRWRKR